MLCPSGMYLTVVPVVRLVLVLAVALVSAGADTYNYIHWRYFQHTELELMNANIMQIGLIEAFMMLMVFIFTFVGLFSHYEHKALIFY